MSSQPVGTTVQPVILTSSSTCCAPARRQAQIPSGRSQENLDVSVTHWAGQYVPQPAWPTVCGPVGYSDPPVTDAEGKDCNVFHGDYTGLAVDSADRVHVVWTGLNRFDQPSNGPLHRRPHDGYVQDAMYARR